MGRFNRFDRRLIVLGLLALLCLSPIGHVIFIMGLVSVIGIPIAILIALIPAIFLVVLTIRLVNLVMPLPGLGGWMLSGIVGIGLLAVPPYFANQRMEEVVAYLLASEQPDVQKPAPPKNLAIVREGNWPKDQACSDFCQRALLNGIAPAVTVAYRENPGTSVSTLSGTRYRFERRADCPAVDVPDGVAPVDLSEEQRDAGGVKASDLMRLRIARGDCLIAEPSAVADADMVIAYGRLRTGKSNYSAGLDIFADTVRAERVTLFSGQGAAARETYRETWITYEPLLPVLTLTLITGSQFDVTSGFLRWPTLRGSARRYKAEANLAPLIGKLGYDLAVRGDAIQQDTRAAIVAALDGAQPVDRANAKVMEDFFQEMSTKQAALPGDDELALRVLRNETVPVPRAAAAPVRLFAARDPDYAQRFAKAAFDRLATTGIDKEDHPTYLGWPLTYLAQAIAALPDDAIRPYRANLEALARDEQKRVLAYDAVKRLSVFGADAVPTLVWLIDDADRFAGTKFGRKQRDQNAWQHPYLAGIGGLCAMGPAGAQAIPALFERLDDGRAVKFGSYWRQMIHTLASLGASPDDAWAHMQTDDKNHTRERFDAEFARARRKAECYF